MWLELSKIHIDTFVFWWLENVGWKVQVVKIIFYTLDIFSSFVGWLENVFVVKIVFWTFDFFVFTLEEKSYTLEICLSTRLNFLHAWTLKIAWTLLKIGCVALLLGWAALPSVQLHLNPETEFGFFLEKKITQELGRQFLLGKKKHNNWTNHFLLERANTGIGGRCNPPFSHFPLWWWEISQTTAPQQ